MIANLQGEDNHEAGSSLLFNSGTPFILIITRNLFLKFSIRIRQLHILGSWDDQLGHFKPAAQAVPILALFDTGLCECESARVETALVNTVSG